MTPKSKVQAWLVNDQQPESPLRKRRRQNSVKSLSKFILDRSNGSTNADSNSPGPNSSTDDFEAELAKIAQDKQKVNCNVSYLKKMLKRSFENEMEKNTQLIFLL